MNYISNAFALSMLDRAGPSPVIEPISLQVAIAAAPECVSIIGHEDTARVFSDLLGTPLTPARRSIKLLPGDSLIVGQYTGPRLPEGATRLPEGASIQWWRVELHFAHPAECR